MIEEVEKVEKKLKCGIFTESNLKSKINDLKTKVKDKRKIK